MGEVKQTMQEKRSLTTDTRVVGFHVGVGDLATLDHERIALAARTAKDGRRVESEVQRACKISCWVA